MIALKDLLQALGCPNLDCRQDGANFDTTARAGYLFNTTIAGIEQADAILLIGTNPRLEAPVVNARIRKRYRDGGLKVGLIGPQLDLSYAYEWLGPGCETLTAIAAGQHPFAKVLQAAARPMLVLGAGVLAREDGAALQTTAREVAETGGLVRDNWNGFNVLHLAAARVGGIEVGFLPQVGGRDTKGILGGAVAGDIEVIYLLGADEVDASRLGKAFVIYQGHHGDRGAHRADVVLPGAAYTEKNGTYVNTEGRVQHSRMALLPVGEAREDWKIVRALSERLGQRLPYDSLGQIRDRLTAINPLFATEGSIERAPWQPFGHPGALAAVPLQPPIDNFYMTDPISRASLTMAKCTDAFVPSREGKTGTHG